MQYEAKSTGIDAFLKSDLFHQVQMERCFDDSKTFADASLLFKWEEIEKAYQEQKSNADFDIKIFVSQHFRLPDSMKRDNRVSVSNIQGYVEQTWSLLTRQPDKPQCDSLIPLPHPYIVPGGRFREIYYWDSYFTTLGLAKDGHQDLINAMWDNFVFLQLENGHVPNGNRHYYRSRSQPPIMALLAQLIEGVNEGEIISALEQEYLFWMGSVADPRLPPSPKVVELSDGTILNRYYDTLDTPRPESYREDMELADGLEKQKRATFFRNLRAACESGWDFSSRWLRDKNDLTSICTTDILPVDLNCLLLILENQLAMRCMQFGNNDKAIRYQLAAAKREQAMQQYFWSPDKRMFFDFDIKTGCQSTVWSAAGLVPLFCGLATVKQAKSLATAIESRFLKKGGIVTTLEASEQQWDAPNGWAPLQWFVVKGLLQYHYHELAFKIMQHWVDGVQQGFTTFSAMMEKYNVEEPVLRAGGGEYEVQTGFGWTNGVTQVFVAMLNGKLLSSDKIFL